MNPSRPGPSHGLGLPTDRTLAIPEAQALQRLHIEHCYACIAEARRRIALTRATMRAVHDRLAAQRERLEREGRPILARAASRRA